MGLILDSRVKLCIKCLLLYLTEAKRDILRTQLTN